MSEHEREKPSPGGEVTLWDFADPKEAADAAVDLYGPDASKAAASAAFTARYAGRKADFQFWFAVFKELLGRGGSA